VTVDANLAVVRRLLEEGWNQGRLEVLDELVAADAVPAHESASPGRQSWKDAIAMYRAAFPDLTYRIEDLFGAGDKVVLRWSATATDTAGFMGRPPTGRQASVTGINIYRLAGAILVEHWDEWDLAGLLQKLS
jgi:predicted ester cyclase